jgi:hypothetical protein
MATLISEVVAQVRDMLGEQVPAQWLSTSIHRWINDGLLDMARVTRHIRDRVTLSTTAGTAEYTVAENVLEIEHAYYLPGDGRYIPLVARQYEGMDAIWGHQQNQQGGDPAMYTVWGASPNLKLRLYPVPSVTGTNNVSLMVVRYPTLLTPSGAENVNIDWPDAWLEAIVAFVEYRALRADRDPRWQEAFQRYQEIRDQMVVLGDYLNTPRDILIDPYVGRVPAWLANGDL